MSADEDREILRHFWEQQLPAQGFDTTKYVYHYEHTGAEQRYVYQAMNLGWEIVRGDMPENMDLRDEKGQCKVGDVVLMRMPIERRKQIDRAMNALNREIMGELTEEQVQRDIDEKMSRLVGHNVKMSFQFKNQRELNQRKVG